MTETNETQYNLKRSYLYPIVRLENALSSRARHLMHRWTVFFLFFFLSLMVGITLINYYNIASPTIELVLDAALPRIFGLTLLLFVFWVVVFLLEGFFRSYYFKEKEDETIQGRSNIPEDMFSFHALRVLLGVKDGDITRAFMTSSLGRSMFHRCGLSDDDILEYLGKRETSLRYPMPAVSSSKIFSLVDLAEYVFESDHDVVDLLFTHGVQKKEYMGSFRWVVDQVDRAKYARRWWTMTNLEKIEGIGADWSYGQAYVLKRYATELSGHEGGASLGSLSKKGQDYLEQVEDILSRGKNSNILLVGNPGEGVLDVVHSFARALHTGEVPLALEGRRPMSLDGELLVSHAGDKTTFEQLLIRVLNDAVNAGNVILVFENLPSFVQSGRAVGSDVISIMTPYFSSTDIQILALSHVDSYHDVLENDPVIRQQFETIILDKIDNDEVEEMLQKVAERLESQSGVMFTYGSLVEAVRSVHQHFSNPVMPDKAIDLIVQLPARVVRDHRTLVQKQDVLALVEQKTGVPSGEIQETERETLLNLEEELHKRVVGQDEAVHTVSNAMRRSRTGIRDNNKPIGSFLFIGPTGVGKTETAKALAELFFGDEEKMSRIDMSEFSGDGAVDRLIGSYEQNKTGVLSRILKKKPYGVLLLDEFEKSSSEVHDLFLQVLDEGFFTDVKGTRVNARDTILIATSNAASDEIYQKVKAGENSQSIREEVVSNIIAQGIFKPEFLNRFDAVVLFHPLDENHVREIARLMLTKLQERLRIKGLQFDITQELTNHVAKKGLDPVFGARPINRYIQEHIEQAIAMKFIKGDIQTGSTFTLSPQDIDA